MSSTRALPRPSLFPEFDLLRLAQAPAWHDSVPSAVREAAGWSDGSRGWRQWQKHLARRRKPRGLAERLARFPLRQAPWRWGLDDAADCQAAAEVLGPLDRVRRGKPIEPEALEALVRELLAEDQPGLPGYSDSLELVGWASALPALAQWLSATRWWELLAHLLQAVNAAKLAPAPADPRVELVLVGELPLSLACVLPELWPCRSLAGEARSVIRESWEQLLDEAGQIRAAQEVHLRPLLASWTRCWHLARALDKQPWPESSVERFLRAWQHALRLTRRDGSQALQVEPALLGQTDSARRGRWLREAATTLNRPGKALADGKSRKRSPADDKLPGWITSAPASSQSGWAQAAVLRSDWSRRANLVAVDHHGPNSKIELLSQGQPWFSGAWSCQVRQNDQTLTVSEPWAQICWTSDEDLDYLELEADLSPSVRIQRQVLLARADRFLLLIDSVLAEDAAPLSYTGRLPLAAQVACSPAEQTRELRLEAPRGGGWVLPLALPEWQCDHRVGSLTVDGQHLTLEQQASGPALAAALWIDLEPRRRNEPLTWRQLTVAEQRSVVPSNAAAAFRVQFGGRQWLIYRSFDGPANRTVLGKNLVTEFFVGRFRGDGNAETLLELEAELE